MSKLVLWIIGTIAGLALSFYNGFVFQTLWNWFVTDLGVTSIPIVTAWGMAVLISWIAYSVPSYYISKQDAQEDAIERVGYLLTTNFFLASFTLITAFIVNLFQ